MSEQLYVHWTWYEIIPYTTLHFLCSFFCFCLLSRYGIGMIYYKQEKFALAEVHFKKALSINPQSSVLMCHVGAVSRTCSVQKLSVRLCWHLTRQKAQWSALFLECKMFRFLFVVHCCGIRRRMWKLKKNVLQVQHALKKSESALATLNKAITTDPKNPLCKFHRASILLATDKHKVSSRFFVWNSTEIDCRKI